jgi:hypothetical protein
MKHEDLIQKLENLETPEIELPGHKQTLKMALLGSGHFRERTIMDWAKILAPVSAAVVLIAVVGFFNVIQPQLHIARAKGIALNDPQVQELMEDYELAITEVELRDGEAFVLLAPELEAASGRGIFSEDTEPPEPTPGEAGNISPGELVPGYILKVDLLEKEVSEFGEIDEVIALKDMTLEDIDFAKFEPPEGAAPEEADPE